MTGIRKHPFYTGAVVTLLALLVATLVLAAPAARRAYAQTVPTITPTSPPDQEPSPPPGSGDPTATSETSTPVATNTAVATNTRQPLTQPTATRTPRTTATRGTTTPTASPTALLSGVTLATAEACGPEPTVRVSRRGAWLYEGPGDSYDRLGRLEAQSVRPVLGRAADVPWWLIDLEGGLSGWIANADVTVQGVTSEVPIVAAPPLPGGATPTPGIPWQPTPNPNCLQPTSTTEPDTPTPPPSPSVTPPSDASPATAAPDGSSSLPLEGDGSGDNLFWLPVAGIVLLAAGAFLYATRRR
jgi:LPXTG-motif cell wall-anchored protein